MSNYNIFSLDTFMIFYIMHCKFIIEVVFSCIALFLYSIKWNMQRSTAISLVLNWMIHLSNLIFIFRVHRCSHSIGVCVKHFYNVLYVLHYIPRTFQMWICDTFCDCIFSNYRVSATTALVFIAKKIISLNCIKSSLNLTAMYFVAATFFNIIATSLINSKCLWMCNSMGLLFILHSYSVSRTVQVASRFINVEIQK